MLNLEDKITIQELITKYNLAIDNKRLDEWINTGLMMEYGLQILAKRKVNQN